MASHTQLSAHPRRKTLIAIVGSASTTPAVAALAERAGRAIVEAGHSLLCGGRTGVMEAAARGAALAPGRGDQVVVGILPGSDADAGNAYLDIVIASGLGLARNSLVVMAADAVLAIEGGAGTLSEIALAWQFEKPIAALSTSGGWAAELAEQCLDQRRPNDKIVGFADPDGAVRWLCTQIRSAS